VHSLPRRTSRPEAARRGRPAEHRGDQLQGPVGERRCASWENSSNPYRATGVDPNGKAAIDWGVYAIPESYLVASDGTILYKRVGPFDDLSLKEGLFPAMEKAGFSVRSRHTVASDKSE
jgi:hypothetical protein